MVKKMRIVAWGMGVGLLVVAAAGCTGGDSSEGKKPPEKAADTDRAVVGSFVGEVSGTSAFVAVVAAPAENGDDSGTIQVYVSDGSGVSESFSGPVSDGSFVAKSDDGDAEAKGELTADSATGTVVLPDGSTGEYEATPPSGAAGLYELTVSSAGELSGASAAGLAVSGRLELEKRGTGKLRLVDGQRLEVSVTRTRDGDLTDLSAGQVRLIILTDGELRGVAKRQPSKGDRSDFFIRSA